MKNEDFDTGQLVGTIAAVHSVGDDRYRPLGFNLIIRRYPGKEGSITSGHTGDHIISRTTCETVVANVASKQVVLVVT